MNAFTITKRINQLANLVSFKRKPQRDHIFQEMEKQNKHNKTLIKLCRVYLHKNSKNKALVLLHSQLRKLIYKLPNYARKHLAPNFTDIELHRRYFSQKFFGISPKNSQLWKRLVRSTGHRSAHISKGQCRSIIYFQQKLV